MGEPRPERHYCGVVEEEETERALRVEEYELVSQEHVVEQVVAHERVRAEQSGGGSRRPTRQSRLTAVWKARSGV